MQRIVLDKTDDGKYWTVATLTGDVAIRLRFEHFSFEEPSEGLARDWSSFG